MLHGIFYVFFSIGVESNETCALNVPAFLTLFKKELHHSDPLLLIQSFLGF